MVGSPIDANVHVLEYAFWGSETLPNVGTKRNATSVRNLVGVILACDS